MEIDILKRIVSGVMKVDPKEITPETTFTDDLGADSLDVCRIVMDIEEEFSITLPKDCIVNVNTIEDAIKLIHNVKSLAKPQ